MKNQNLQNHESVKVQNNVIEHSFVTSNPVNDLLLIPYFKFNFYVKESYKLCAN